MTNATENQLVSDVAHDLLNQLAPQELPLFRATSEAYFKNPQKALKGQLARDETLGFGSGEAAILLTPLVLAVTTEVVKFLAEEIKKSVKEESSSLISASVKKVFKKFRPQEKADKKTPPPLSPEQLAQVREIALKKARQLKLPEARAKLLADSVVGSLAVTS